MKKIFSMALLAALALGTTSCLGNGDDDVANASIYMYNFVVNENDPKVEPTLSQATSSFEINYTRNLISCAVKAASDMGMSASFMCTELPMTISKQSFQFTQAKINATGQTIENFVGNLDPTVGAITLSYKVDGNYSVYSTGDFGYNFTKMVVFEGSELLFEDEDLAFEIVPDCSAKTLKLRIVNFVRTTKDVPVNVSYKDIPFTLNRDGRIVVDMADACKNSESADPYEITNLLMSVNVKGSWATVSFTMNERQYTLTGHMFAPIGE